MKRNCCQRCGTLNELYSGPDGGLCFDCSTSIQENMEMNYDSIPTDEAGQQKMFREVLRRKHGTIMLDPGPGQSFLAYAIQTLLASGDDEEEEYTEEPQYSGGPIVNAMSMDRAMDQKRIDRAEERRVASMPTRW